MLKQINENEKTIYGSNGTIQAQSGGKADGAYNIIAIVG